jgi:hypothetical protein
VRQRLWWKVVPRISLLRQRRRLLRSRWQQWLRSLWAWTPASS